MNLRALVPFASRSNATRPEAGAFGTLHREIDRLFDDFTRGFGVGTPMTNSVLPSIDVTETDKQIVITVELPGLERKDVDVTLEDNILTIRGEKKIETEPKDDKTKRARVRRAARRRGAGCSAHDGTVRP